MLLASCDVILFSQIAARTHRGFFTLGDGCWLPNSWTLASLLEVCYVKTLRFRWVVISLLQWYVGCNSLLLLWHWLVVCILSGYCGLGILVQFLLCSVLPPSSKMITSTLSSELILFRAPENQNNVVARSLPSRIFQQLEPCNPQNPQNQHLALHCAYNPSNVKQFKLRNPQTPGTFKQLELHYAHVPGMSTGLQPFQHLERHYPAIQALQSRNSKHFELHNAHCETFRTISGLAQSYEFQAL